MKVTQRSVEDFLDSVEGPTRADIISLHKQIMAHMPGVLPKVWEGVFWGGSKQTIIGFGDLRYLQSSGKTVEWFMVGLGRQKKYISIYINAVRGSRLHS